MKKTKQIFLSILSSINLFSLKSNASLACSENKNTQSDSDKYICEVITKASEKKLSYMDKNIYNYLKLNKQIVDRISTAASETGSKTTTGSW